MLNCATIDNSRPVRCQSTSTGKLTVAPCTSSQTVTRVDCSATCNGTTSTRMYGWSAASSSADESMCSRVPAMSDGVGCDAKSAPAAARAAESSTTKLSTGTKK